MSQLAAHNLAMSSFYGTQPGEPYGSKQTTQGEGQGLFRYASMIVGLLSLFTIIALNVTNIIYMTGSGGTMESIKNSQQSLSGTVKEMSGVVIEDIKPKTDLINSMVSYNIPSQLTIIHNLIKNEVLRQCTPSFMFNNTICPIAENPIHTHYLEEINLELFSECKNPDGNLEVNTPIEYIEYPSFIPGSTKPGSCTRLPSFSLSSTVFAYTHTIMGHGCSELDVGDHYFSIGRITDHGHEQPIFETLTEWFINDKINRRSCTVAAGKMGAWMGCVIMTETFFDDVESTDTGRITISFMDVFGRKKEWMYSKSEIHYDQVYTALYFSVGSGAVIGDTVYFLVWGTLRDLIDQPAYCVAPGCVNYDQRRCNEAQRPAQFGHRQVVNGLLSFKTNVEGKPSLLLRTFSPTDVPLGSEGRLIRFESLDRTYVYVRSTGWHSLPLTGILILGPPIRISWTTQMAVSRPGDHPCGASNRCPRDCVTGVYTDLFPLGFNFEYSMTAFLNAELYRVNPTLALINTSNSIYTKTLTNPSQQTGYTTTTCFIFKLRVWCLSIVEMSPATITSFEPIPFLYQLDVGCRNKRTGNIEPLSGRNEVYKLGRFEEPRNECFFERVDQNVYFVISIPNSIQAYEVKDLDPSSTDRVNPYITDVCSLALEAFKKMAPNSRRSISIMVGHWQFRPVQVNRGVKLEFSNGFVGRVDPKFVAPEDPGFETFPGEFLSASACLHDLAHCYRALDPEGSADWEDGRFPSMTPTYYHTEVSSSSATGVDHTSIDGTLPSLPQHRSTGSPGAEQTRHTRETPDPKDSRTPTANQNSMIDSTSGTSQVVVTGQEESTAGISNQPTNPDESSASTPYTDGMHSSGESRTSIVQSTQVSFVQRNRSEARDDINQTHRGTSLPDSLSYSLGTSDVVTIEDGSQTHSMSTHAQSTDVSVQTDKDSITQDDRLPESRNYLTSTFETFSDYYSDGVKKGMIGTTPGEGGFLNNTAFLGLQTTIYTTLKALSEFSGTSSFLTNIWSTSASKIAIDRTKPETSTASNTTPGITMSTNTIQPDSINTTNISTITTSTLGHPETPNPASTGIHTETTPTLHTLTETDNQEPSREADATEHPPLHTPQAKNETIPTTIATQAHRHTTPLATRNPNETSPSATPSPTLPANTQTQHTTHSTLSPDPEQTTKGPTSMAQTTEEQKQRNSTAPHSTQEPSTHQAPESRTTHSTMFPPTVDIATTDPPQEHTTIHSTITPDTTHQTDKPLRGDVFGKEGNNDHEAPRIDAKSASLIIEPLQHVMIAKSKTQVTKDKQKKPRFKLTPSECPPSMHDQLCYEIKRYMRVLEDQCSGKVDLNVPILAVGYVLTSSWRQSGQGDLLPPMYYLCMHNKGTSIHQLPEHTYTDPKNGENREIRWGSFALDLSTWSRKDDDIPTLPFSKMDLMMLFGDIDPSIPPPFCVIIEACGYPIVVYNSGERYIPFMLYNPVEQGHVKWEGNYDSRDLCYHVYTVMAAASDDYEYTIGPIRDDTKLTLKSIDDSSYMSYTAMGGECFDREYSRSYVYSFLRSGNTDIYSIYSFDFDIRSEIIGFGSFQVPHVNDSSHTERMSLDSIDDMKSIYGRYWT
ncbi:cell attachment protein [Ninapo virus]|nr:cell attachment protein [Ninapo virus]